MKLRFSSPAPQNAHPGAAAPKSQRRTAPSPSTAAQTSTFDQAPAPEGWGNAAAREQLREQQDAPRLGSPGADLSCTPEVAPSAEAIDGNTMAITGDRRGLDRAAIERVQQRLIEIGSLSAAGYPNGQMDDTTRQAIETFQISHQEDVDRIQQDSQWMQSEDNQRW